MEINTKNCRGFSLVELMTVVALLGILVAVGPNMLLKMVQFYRLQMARGEVQRDARATLELTNRFLRQATATSVIVSQRTNQPPYSWIAFSITKGTGTAVGHYGIYQDGKNLNFMNNGSTQIISENLRYLSFTYPQSDDTQIISVSMTFDKDTYARYTKALQLSVEKVRIMN